MPQNKDPVLTVCKAAKTAYDGKPLSPGEHPSIQKCLVQSATCTPFLEDFVGMVAKGLGVLDAAECSCYDISRGTRLTWVAYMWVA